MLCPDCNVWMNHHAAKIDYAAEVEDSGEIDEDFGGILEEVHTCPVCGRTHMRRAYKGK
jgi:hypothetical protein